MPQQSNYNNTVPSLTLSSTNDPLSIVTQTTDLSLDEVPGAGDTIVVRLIVVLHSLLHIGVDNSIHLAKILSSGNKHKSNVRTLPDALVCKQQFLPRPPSGR